MKPKLIIICIIICSATLKFNNAFSQSSSAATTPCGGCFLGWNNGTTGQVPLEIRTNNLARINIEDQSGNVGIGTTTPNQLLHVAGNTNLTTAFRYRINDVNMLSGPGFGTRNVFVGIQTDIAGTNATDNTFTGYNAGNSLTTGDYNTFIGTESGKSLTQNINNTFIGYQAGYANNDNATATNSSGNTFVGFKSGTTNTTAKNNTFMGTESGKANLTGADNVFIGKAAGIVNYDGNYNSFIGSNAGYSNTSGAGNTFFGADAGFSFTQGSNNVILGYISGGNLTTSANNDNNVIIGSLAGSGGGITTATSVTLVGYSADATLNNITNAAAIGANATVSASDNLILGNNCNVGIGTTAALQKLHVVGTMRLTGSDGTATTVMGRDADGDVSAISVGTTNGLTFTSNTLDFNGNGFWSTIGNSGLSNSTNYIGTDDAIDFIVRTNNTERMRVIGGATNTGNVGIHTTTPTAKLHALEDAANSFNKAIYGISDNATSTNYGVYGEAVSGNSSRDYGVFGTVTSGSTDAGVTGVFGTASASSDVNYGGQFIADGTSLDNYGVYGQANGSATTNYGVYGVAGVGTTNYAGYFSGDLVYTGALNPSDINLKDNIAPLENSLSIIEQLNPKSYTFRQIDFPNMNLLSGTHYGLISQEVELVIPDLVGDVVQPPALDNLGNEISPRMTFRGLRYNELIPFLIAAIKEQQLQIQDLNTRLTSCCGPGIVEFQVPDNGYNQPSTINHQQLASIARDLPVLSQNQPNPFSEKTLIRFYIPKSTKDAAIRVFDNTGSVYRLFSITGEGPGSIELEANSLATGNYYYSLLIGGNVIDTKTMVITK